MLNLKKSVVTDFWQRTDPRLARILSVMENIEHWIVDDVECVAQALADVGKRMDKSSKKTLATLSEELIYAMAYISSGKFFRMVKWMDESHPGLSVHYIMGARQMQANFAPARLMVDRIQTIHSLKLMGQVFAPSRTRLIAELLRDEKR